MFKYKFELDCWDRILHKFCFTVAFERKSFDAINALLCSSFVVYGMVPFLNAILGTMLPMLNMAKQDNMKWVFSSGMILENTLPAVQLLIHEMFLKRTPVDVCVSPALCHFSDSILEYLANLDKAPDPTVRKDTFSSEIYAAFDILFNNWLQSRESKVRAAIRLSNWVSCVLQLKDHDAFQL